jgi:para-aminobenzoate synthetase component I
LRFFLDQLERPAAAEEPSARLARRYRLTPRQLAPQYPTRWSEDWTSNFTAQGYREAVGRCVEYIRAGDVFQVNLSQRLLRNAFCSPEQLALHLRQQSPAPFAGYADFGRTQVISSSPERFFAVECRRDRGEADQGYTSQDDRSLGRCWDGRAVGEQRKGS